MIDWYRKRQQAKRMAGWQGALAEMVGTADVLTVMRRFGQPHLIVSDRPRCWVYEWQGETITLHFDSNLMLSEWGAHFESSNMSRPPDR